MSSSRGVIVPTTTSGGDAVSKVATGNAALFLTMFFVIMVIAFFLTPGTILTLPIRVDGPQTCGSGLGGSGADYSCIDKTGECDLGFGSGPEYEQPIYTGGSFFNGGFVLTSWPVTLLHSAVIAIVATLILFFSCKKIFDVYLSGSSGRPAMMFNGTSSAGILSTGGGKAKTTSVSPEVIEKIRLIRARDNESVFE